MCFFIFFYFKIIYFNIYLFFNLIIRFSSTHKNHEALANTIWETNITTQNINHCMLTLANQVRQ